mgnify:CR=1 FL=1
MVVLGLEAFCVSAVMYKPVDSWVGQHDRACPGMSGLSQLTMLSLEECKKYVGDDLSDEKIIELRDVLYSFAESALDKHLFGGSVPVSGHEKDHKH